MRAKLSVVLVVKVTTLIVGIGAFALTARSAPGPASLATAALAAQSEPSGQASEVADDLLEMSLEELMQVDVGVASRIHRSSDRQPASVTMISRAQIQVSGARTLNELLMRWVPGYFLVEDQDDTIAAVRGLSPDNNSKIMLLLDGRNLNAEWFWGPPDALLNGLALEHIERLEVIRGPGSVTHGQGALLGVINIVTRGDGGSSAALVLGERGRFGLSAGWRYQDEQSSAQLFLSDGRFAGAPYREEGLGLQFEQGLSVFQRNHRLKRGDYRHVLARYQRRDPEQERGWEASAYQFMQLRDLYNWRRDREQVEQRLDGLELRAWRPLWGGEFSIELSRHLDDYGLQTHGGSRPEASRQVIPELVLGGHREARSGARLLWIGEPLTQHRMALGAEINTYRSGLANRHGNNFIINLQETLLARGLTRVRLENRWVIPDKLNVKSLFFEDFFALAANWELFVAARWDTHPDWGSQTSPRLGAIWQVSDTQQWRVSLQRGFRGAVGVSYSGGFEGDGLLRESNFAAVESNPFFQANGNRNLRPVEPETLTSLELAWQWQANDRVSVAAVGFLNEVRNVIGVGAFFLEDSATRERAINARTRIGSDVIGDWGGVFFFQNNNGALRHQGLELETQWRWPEADLTLNASQSLVRVRSASEGQFGPGNIYVSGSHADPRNRAFPERVSRISLDWTLTDRLQVQLSSLYYPSWLPPIQQRAGIAFTPKLDGNAVTNLGLQWRFPRWHSSLGLEAINIFNANNLSPANSVAGEGEGNLGVPGIERRSFWLTWRWNKGQD